jgi:hypothetical protein
VMTQVFRINLDDIFRGWWCSWESIIEMEEN